MTAPATLIRRPRIAPVWRRPLAIVGILFVSFWFITMIIVPFLPLADPLAQDFTPLSPPSGTHPFGTDILGRDVLSRTLFGSRATLPFAILLVIISLILGSLVGAIAGYFGGVIDEIIMRIADLVFAFPTIVLAMVVAAALGPGITNAVIALALISWPNYARVIRSLVLSARNQEYVVAGRLLGAGPLSSLRRDILPNVASPMLVLAMLDLGSQILLLSGLSFLGLGAVPPAAEWGSMVGDGVQQFSNWWLAAFPGLAILTVVVGFNFIGDTLRDSLDPRSANAVTQVNA
ncbi:MAG: D-ala-D-ala transporter subunit [Candidatus Lumbricidophila eiseniae]|uniref:D-ala-D-ala transporter subunit n=1 Tax=Candidatus Lumbricidiphila eiseniae TaxID=1969409 RepID=A0A2A6FPC6_9MICO|nr:MAG: D-ala-D-ala transporter subunit [Candidatus Lumbricidophila eiseniae]